MNVDENELDEWIKKNNIPFPVGMIKTGEKKTQTAWGLKSLPWLILADKNKIVRTEGFALEELDEIIKKSNELRQQSSFGGDEEAGLELFLSCLIVGCKCH